MSINIVPETKVPEIALGIALKNIIEGIADLFEEVTPDVANEWAREAGIAAPNIFMKEKVAEILAQHLAGFILTVQPRPQQFTGDHVAAFNTPLLPPDDSKDPEPLGE